MKRDTWVKLYREFLDWEWFHKSEMVHLFVWLLLKANTTERSSQGRTIARGELVTTFKEMREETKISYQTLRTCIERLKSTNEITTKSTNKNTIITICNYERYQQRISEINEQTNEQTNEQSTNGSTVICTVTNKNERIINNIINARTREGEYINQLKSEQAWIEIMAKNYGTDVLSVQELLDTFRTDCECRGSVHRDLSDARNHFNNWLMKRKQNAAAAPKSARAGRNANINDLWKQ